MMSIQPTSTGGAEALVQADGSVRHAKLLHAAQQFEAIMLEVLLKPLGKSAAIDGDDDAEAAGPMQSFGVEAMAGSLAQSGALGFANQIVNSMEHRDPRAAPRKSTTKVKVPLTVADTPRGGSST